MPKGNKKRTNKQTGSQTNAATADTGRGDEEEIDPPADQGYEIAVSPSTMYREPSPGNHGLATYPASYPCPQGSVKIVGSADGGMGQVMRSCNPNDMYLRMSTDAAKHLPAGCCLAPMVTSPSKGNVSKVYNATSHTSLSPSASQKATGLATTIGLFPSGHTLPIQTKPAAPTFLQYIIYM